MGTFSLLAVGALVLIIMGAVRSSRKSQVKNRRLNPARSQKHITYDASLLPERLGLLPETALEQTESRLLKAIDGTYKDKVQARVLSKFPTISPDEFECRLLELKRYFLISALLKETPMFSEPVDEVWHEMLMFTREYQQFGEMFLGETIHHSPNAEPIAMPGERAWFDWLYAHLFAPTPFSSMLWNGFCRYPFDKERLSFIEHADPDEIVMRWFHSGNAKRLPEIGRAIHFLACRLKDEVAHASAHTRFNETLWKHEAGNSFLYLTGGMLFFSMVDAYDYDRHLHELMEPLRREVRKPYDGAGSSACGSSVCGAGFEGGEGFDSDPGTGTGSDGDSGSGGESGGSSGCSSSSSCGGSSGCGSSCGSS